MAKNRKRKEICETATKLFVEKGFEKTTIRDIARAGGINSSALYYYFEDKEAVLYRILIDIMDDSLERMRRIEQNKLSLKDKLFAVIKMHTEIYGVDPLRMELIVHNQKSLNPEHWEELKSKQKEYAKIVSGILSKMKERGEILDANPMACTFALFGMIQWSYSWYNSKGEIKPDNLSDLFTRLFMNGILTKT
jgi:TetR/AcrR family transcriptional regulator, cholesterol catabolism regulator